MKSSANIIGIGVSSGVQFDGYLRCRRWWRDADSNKIIAFGTILLGALGIAGLVLTYEALSDNRKAFEATQRPFVSLGRKDGTIAEFVVPKDPDLPDQNVGIKIYLQNGGQSPALTPNLGLLPLNLVLNGIGTGQSTPPKVPLQKNNFQHLLRSADKNGGHQSNAGVASIAPQSEYVYFFSDQISREQYESMIRGQRALMLMGICEYCDALYFLRG